MEPGKEPGQPNPSGRDDAPGPRGIPAEYKALFDRRIFCVYAHDLQGNFLDANDAALHLLGYSREEVSSLNFGHILEPEDLQTAVETTAEIVRTGFQSRPKEYRLRRKDGATVWMETEAWLVRPAGEPPVVMGIALDTTSRKAAERLHESEERFRAVADYTYDCECWYGIDGRLIWINPAAERVTGFSCEECRAMDSFPLSIVYPADRAALEEELRGARDGTSGNDVPFRIVLKDGSVRWVAVSWQSIFDDRGACLGYRSSIRDVSLRRQVEDALRASEERYRRMFEDSPISLWEEDYSELWGYLESLRNAGVRDFRSYFAAHPDTLPLCASLVKIVHVNKATLKMYQAESVRDFIGGLDRIFGPDAYKVFEKGIVALASGETRFESEAVNNTLKGEKRQILIRWTVVPDTEKPFGNVLVSVIDITDIKALERERANLTAMFAHDMKSSLVGIQGLVMRLLNKALEIQEEKREKYLHVIRTEAAKLDFLVDDFLEYSRLQANKLTLNLVPFPLDREILEIFELYQPLAQEKGIRLELDCADPLPLIKADANRLRRVFLNLLDNAFKFCPKEGATVTLSAREEGDHVRVCVADQGAGIDPEDIPFIFDPFHRGRLGSGVYRGHGVGLAAVKTIVEGHGGRVSVQSEKGRGSTFTVCLPKNL